LIARIEELNAYHASTSSIEHVSICTRCRYVDAIDDHLALIKNQNDHIAKLDAKLAEYELENEKFKFPRSMLYNRRRPIIKDSVGFQPGGKESIDLNAHGRKIPHFVKGKAPMINDRDGYILYPKNYPAHKMLEKTMLRKLSLMLIMLIFM
jgi:hypothetical protein